MIRIQKRSEELPVSEANKSFGVGVRFFENGMVELLLVVVVGVVGKLLQCI